MTRMTPPSWMEAYPEAAARSAPPYSGGSRAVRRHVADRFPGRAKGRSIPARAPAFERTIWSAVAPMHAFIPTMPVVVALDGRAVPGFQKTLSSDDCLFLRIPFNRVCKWISNCPGKS